MGRRLDLDVPVLILKRTYLRRARRRALLDGMARPFDLFRPEIGKARARRILQEEISAAMDRGEIVPLGEVRR